MDNDFEPNELQDPGDYDVELKTRRRTIIVATLASGAVIIQAISRIWTMPPLLMVGLFVVLLIVTVSWWRRPGAFDGWAEKAEPQTAKSDALESGRDDH